jgi:chaperone LolA
MIPLLFLILLSPKEEFLKTIEGVKSFEAEFKERVNYPGFEISQKFSGKLYGLRPNFFRMEVDSPTKQLLIMDGKNAWLYLREDGVVYKRKSGDFFHNAGIFFLSQELDIRYVGNGGERKFVLIPKKEAPYDSVVVVSNRSYLPKEILIFAKDGSTMDFTLYNMRVNIPLNRDMFQFRIPKDAELIED